MAKKQEMTELQLSRRWIHENTQLSDKGIIFNLLKMWGIKKK